MALNIIDIAKLAGVSKSTVSRYLNNGYVGSESRDKIKKVLEETGFTPQRQAKGMRTKKTNLIGVIVPKISTTTVSRVVEGITDVLSPMGYDILIANTSLSIEKELEYLKIFKNNQVDGIIFMATKITNEHIEAMNQVEVPIVIVSQQIDKYPSVYHDDYNSAKEMTEYIISKGHTNIGFIGVYEEDKAVGVERKRGYTDGLLENNIKVKKRNIKLGDFSQSSGYMLAEKLMNQKDKPTAIFAVTDTLAIGAMEYLKENNYKIPEEVAVVGMGDSEMSKVVTPKLTTIHFEYKTSGIKSGRMLMNILENGQEKYGKDIKLCYRLIKRESV